MSQDQSQKSRRASRIGVRLGAPATLLACAMASALLTAGPAAARPAARSALVPVWVFLDGDTPVAGGQVRVYAGALHANGVMAPVRARPLRQRNGARQEGSAASGVALLNFARLPRDFTVVVSGGRAGGERLSGSLSVQVRGYRSSVGNVVMVDPITTLVQSWRRVDPRVSTRRARRTVDRALGIPAWADDIDLRATDRWFNGDAFLRAASRGTHAVAQIDREIGDLLASIRRGGRAHRFYARHPRAAEAAVPVNDAGNPIVQWWKDLDIQQLVTGGMSDLGVSVLKWGAEQGGKWLLGHLLDAWGLKSVKDFLLPKSDTTVIIEMLNALNQKVTDLQDSVDSVKTAIAEAQKNTLIALSNGPVADITTLSSKLAFIASLKPDDPDRIDESRKLVNNIGKLLVDKNVASRLNLDLVGGSFSDGILKAISQSYGSKRFFTHQSSQEIQAAYNYFAVLQLELANLLTEYWSTNPIPVGQGACSPTCVKREVDQINTNIAAQKAQLKPELPSNKFIDTRTMLMWDARPQWVSGLGYKPAETCRPSDFLAGATSCTLASWWVNPATAPGTTLGQRADFGTLIDNWWSATCGGKGTPPHTCKNPLEYLHDKAGLDVSAPKGTPEDFRGHMWLGPTPVNRLGPTCYRCAQTIERINLSETERPGPHIFTNNLTSQDPQAYFASAMTRQLVAPGSYWWPLGGK